MIARRCFVFFLFVASGFSQDRFPAGRVNHAASFRSKAVAAHVSANPRNGRLQTAELQPQRKMTAPPDTATAIFLTALSYDSGGLTPVSIAAGDFNGDGKLDLAVANSGSNNVGVMLGNGDGTYQPVVLYNTGSNTTYVIAADLNGDGVPDLAVGAGSVVSILLGKGDGTFSSAGTFSSGDVDTPSIAAGDFNHDGKMDLAIAHACFGSSCPSGSVSILLGNGDGTFQPPTSYASGGQAASFIQVADFNGDGKLDLALANDTSTSGTADSIGILLGNGDGTFQSAVSYNSGGYGNAFVAGLAIGDFNADGKLDLAMADFGTCGGAKTTCPFGSVNVLLGNGDGTFQPVVSYGVGPDAAYIAAGDVNGDGKPDLVVANYCGVAASACGDEGTVSVLIGNGDGTFQTPIALDTTVGGFAGSLALGDFNRDGKLDVAVANLESLCCTDGSVGVLLGDGDGTYQSTLSFPTLEWEANTVVAGDFNGDGKTDLAVGSNCTDGDSCPKSAVSILLGNGDGTFQWKEAYSYLGGGFDSPSVVAIGDFNRDGKLDLVATGTNGATGTNVAGVSVLLGNGDGTFQTPVVYSTNGTAASWVGLGDFNGDGKLDLAVANLCSDSSCANGALSILLGNGDGTFQTPITNSSIGELNNVLIGDFNNDGKLDLAMPEFVCTAQSCSFSFIVMLGNGDGTFQPAVTYDTGGITPLAVTAGDFNGDGKPDLAVLNQCTAGNDCTVGIVGVLLGNGDGTFRVPVTYAAIANLDSVTANDFNGDGKLDLLVSGSNSVGLMLGNGDGSFQSPTTYLVGGGGLVGVADLNGDGKPDVVLPGNETVSILMNVASGFRFTTSTTASTSANPAIAGQSITFTASVTGVGSASPTGTVTFNDGSMSLGTVSLANGRASFTTSLSAGAHSISIAYSGDSTFLPSLSATFTETVNAAPDFSISSFALTPGSVQPGTSSTSVISIAALNGFNDSVALTCSVTPASAMAPTCSVSPASINAGATATLTVNTTAPVAANASHRFTALYAFLFPILGLVVTGRWFRSPNPKRQRHLGSVILGCFLLAALITSIACGGTGTVPGNKSSGSGGTPAGTYTVTVTGTSTGSVQHSVSAMLTVQ
jgi:hypothetical protein